VGFNLSRKEKWADVNHYCFHLVDPDWGPCHICVAILHFGAQVIANGHEWAEHPAHKQNSLIQRSQQTLCALHTVGRPCEACDRWLYASCFCRALNLAEQERAGFPYDYSAFQLEYSRNLLFRRGRTMKEVYEKALERTRVALYLKKLKTSLAGNIVPYNHRQ
jgi:hypothetical protein